MTAYVARTAPFADFLLVLEGDRASAPAGAEQDGGARCLFLSGLVELDGELIAAADDVTLALRRGLTAEGLAACRGQFVAVLQAHGTFFVVNDLFGLEHIYLFEHGDSRVVSNRFACIVQHMKVRGLRRRPNLGAVAAGLFARHHFFRQIHSHRLPVEGVLLVPVDAYLAVDGRRVATRTKTGLAAALAGTDARPYDRLVEEGADDVVASCRAVAESPLFVRRLIELTGGRDSRLTLAAALRAGVLDRMETVTRDVAGSDDLSVALVVAQWAGCRFQERDDVPTYARSVRFKMMVHRSMSMGLYHVVSDTPWSALGSHFGTVRLTGGCGEVYSRFWLNVFAVDLHETDEDGVLPRLFSQVRGVDGIPRGFRAVARDSFTSSIRSLPGRHVAEKLENHYLFFRNRTHFGSAGLNAFHGALPWSPLVSASLLAASRRLPFADRSSDRLDFDALTRIQPALAFFPYNGGERWPEDLLRRVPGAEELRRVADRVDASGKHAEWLAAQERRRASARAHRRELEPAGGPARLVEHVSGEVSDVLDRLRQADPELAPLLPAALERRLVSMLKRNRREGLHLASKILALYDCCFDEEAISLSTGALPLREEYDLRDPLAGAAVIAPAEPSPRRLR